MSPDTLLLGVDGGGTSCRARLCSMDGIQLGEAVSGPANIRLGLDRSLASISEAVERCLAQADLAPSDLNRTMACLALAGASEPVHLAEANGREFPFALTTITTDARAACIGAHRGQPGGIIIAGTGTIGWAEPGGRRVGGWGMPLSDEGSGAWIGWQALRQVLWAYDGRTSWTPLLEALFDRFDGDPHSIVLFSSKALPRDFGQFAPVVIEYTARDDSAGIKLMQAAGRHIDRLSERLIALDVQRIALMGGLAPTMAEWVSPVTRSHLVRPEGDALDGAVRLARFACEAKAA